MLEIADNFALHRLRFSKVCIKKKYYSPFSYYTCESISCIRFEIVLESLKNTSFILKI